MLRNVRRIADEMIAMTSHFGTEGNVHERLSKQSQDDYERGWHDGMAAVYRMAAKNIFRWVHEETLGVRGIQAEMQTLMDVFSGWSHKVPSPNDATFMKGNYNASALKSSELLLIIRSWHDGLFPKRKWFKHAS